MRHIYLFRRDKNIAIVEKLIFLRKVDKNARDVDGRNAHSSSQRKLFLAIKSLKPILYLG